MPKILIIDDNKEVIECFKYQLEQNNFIVNFINNDFDNCLKNIEEINPDLILMDVDLNNKNIDGVDLSRKIKGNVKLTKKPIVILTCEDDKTKKHNIFNNSFCEAYVNKEADIEDLIDIINIYL